MDNIELIGYIATCFSALSLLPEIIKALRTHHLRDLAWGMMGLMVTSSALWLYYGAAKLIIPLTISASMNLFFGLTLVSLKIHYARAKRPLMRAAVQTEAVLSDPPKKKN